MLEDFFNFDNFNRETEEDLKECYELVRVYKDRVLCKRRYRSALYSKLLEEKIKNLPLDVKLTYYLRTRQIEEIYYKTNFFKKILLKIFFPSSYNRKYFSELFFERFIGIKK